MNGLEDSENRKLLKQRTEQFGPHLTGIREGVFRVFVGHHDVDGELPDFGFEQVIIDFNAQFFTDFFDGVLDQANNVGSGEDVVSVLVVDFVHHRIDDEQGDDGKGEGNESHPPCGNTGGTTGEHGGFTASTQFCPHQDIAPITQILDGPAGARSSVFNSHIRMLGIVDKGKKGKGFLGKRVFKLDAL